jgi:hypothetical protein
VARIYILLLKAGLVDAKELGPDPDQKTIEEGMQLALGQLVSLCEENGLPLIIFTTDFTPWQYETVSSFSDDPKVTVYNLDEAFSGNKKPARIHKNRHWNAHGHELAYKFIAEKLLLLPLDLQSAQ